MRRLSLFPLLLFLLMPVPAQARQWVLSPDDPLTQGEFFLSGFYGYSENQVGTTLYQRNRFGFALAGSPHDHVILRASVPFEINSIMDSTVPINEERSGISDVSLGATIYLLLDHNEESRWDMNLSGGVTLPTGKYDLIDAIFISSESIQPGSDALGYYVSLGGSFRTQRMSVGGNLSFSDGGSSPITDFGNSVGAGLGFAFKPLILESGSLPEQGLLITFSSSVAAFSAQQRKPPFVPFTRGGGWIAHMSPGIEYYVGNFVLDFSATVPVAYDLKNGFEPENFSVGVDAGFRY